MQKLEMPKAFMLDMDGVLFHGARVLAGAPEFMQGIQEIPHVFVTNNPIRTPEQVVQKLHALGSPPVMPEQVITSGTATAQWLARETPAFRYYAVGAPALSEVLEKEGHAAESDVDYVVVGEGEGLTFETLTKGINLVSQGATLVSTNPDNSVDAEEGILPGGGALVAPFALASGQKPVTIGKPFPLLFKMGLERLGVEAADCIMVGDRPDTDIAGAKAVGMRTVLVRTGRFGANDVVADKQQKPDWDVRDLSELMSILF